METHFFSVDLAALGLDLPGRLAIAPKPSCLEALRQAGVDILVSALTAKEADKLGLADEPARAAAAGMDFRSAPIPDFSVPQDTAATVALADELAAAVRAGRFVVCHCRGGKGRSTLLAGATLIRLGVPPHAAMTAIGAARGHRVPETRKQRNWLRDLA